MKKDLIEVSLEVFSPLMTVKKNLIQETVHIIEVLPKFQVKVIYINYKRSMSILSTI